MIFDYIAKRSIQAGNTIDQQYQIDVEVSRQNYASRIKGPRNESISGSVVHVQHYQRITYDIATVPIQDTDTPDNEDMLEFLNSVIQSEVFQCDVSGTSEDYIMDNPTNPWRRRRLGSTDIFIYEFRIRKYDNA